MTKIIIKTILTGTSPVIEKDTIMNRKIIVKTILTRTSPVIEIFEARVEDEKSEWRETFGSKELLAAFVKGVRAGAALCGQPYLTVADERNGARDDLG